MARKSIPLPPGFCSGALTVLSDKCKYFEDRKYNRWGYFCRCALCKGIRWYPESTVKYQPPQSCGCQRPRQWTPGQVSEAEKEFVRRYTRD